MAYKVSCPDLSICPFWFPALSLVTSWVKKPPTPHCNTTIFKPRTPNIAKITMALLFGFGNLIYGTSVLKDCPLGYWLTFLRSHGPPPQRRCHTLRRPLPCKG